MGLSFHDTKRLWEARVAGQSFESTLIVSRQQLFLHPHEAAALRRSVRERSPGEAPVLEQYRFGDYADLHLRPILGAKSLESMDFSDYEGASLVHDLNLPVPEEWHVRFDAVIEAGTLEHIFNFPVAIRNIMMLVKPGGAVYLTLVANNLCGHGFYQFSPELVFRIFSVENGFASPRVVLLEGTFPAMERVPVHACYEVTDPAKVGRRVGLQSNRPVMMIVEARKIAHCEPFKVPPQQSDYAVAWSETAANGPTRPGGLRVGLKRLYRSLPEPWLRRVEGFRERRQFSLSNQEFYRKL